MIFHDCGHSCAYTAYQRSARNHIVEWGLLTPFRCVQKDFLIASGGTAHNAAAHLLGGWFLELGCRLDFILKATHHPFHSGGHRGDIIVVFKRIAKHGSSTVVGRDDNESLTLACVEYVVERFCCVAACIHKL